MQRFIHDYAGATAMGCALVAGLVKPSAGLTRVRFAPDALASRRSSASAGAELDAPASGEAAP